MTPIRPAVCERTRSYASARLDGELAELEARMLEAHLGACAACRAYAAEVAAITRAVRATPLEQVRVPAVQALRRTAVGMGAFRHVAAVAAGLFVVVGAGNVLDGGGDPREPRRQSPVAWPTPKSYLTDAALREEQSLMALTRPGTPLIQLRF